MKHPTDESSEEAQACAPDDVERERRAQAALESYFRARTAEVAAARVLDRFHAQRPAGPRIRALTPPGRTPMIASPWGRARSLAAVLAVLVIVLWNLVPRRPPALVLAEPGASVADGRRNLHRAEAGEMVRAHAPCTLALGGLRIQLRPGAALGVERLPDGAPGAAFRLRQHAGEAVYRLEPGGGVPLSVEVPGGRVRVTGTAFRVRIAGPATDVAVGEGTVELDADAVTPLSAGHAARLQAAGRIEWTGPFNLIADPDFARAARVRTGTSR